MIRNYITVALRNLSRNRFFSAINIFGLALSLSVCLGIIMLVADQLRYDRHNTRRERIFRVTSQQLDGKGMPLGNDYATAPLALAEELRDHYTGIEKAVRIRRGFGNGWVEFDQDLSIPLGGFFADPEILDVFQLDLQYGNPATALTEPYSVVLTAAAVEKLFTVPNPVGEIIKVGKLGEFKVTGVLRESREKSHIVFEALASFSTLKSLEATNHFSPDDRGWNNFTAGWVYALLREGTSANDFQRHLDEIGREHKPAKTLANEERSYKFNHQNLCAITPGPFINNAIGPFMPRVFVYFFGGLALIVMITSCFNYTNLSIARALTRAREIGIRKVSGASRSQVFGQFMSEAVVIALLSLGAALVLLVFVKPFLLNLKFAQVLKWDLNASPSVYLSFLAFTLFVGLLAGFFPAVVLSGFQPVKVLKKIGSVKLFSRIALRKSLLVIQFALSLIFIISALLLYNQLSLFTSTDHGFAMNGNLMVRLNSTSYEQLKTRLQRYPNIVNVAGASHVPAAGVTYADPFKKELSSDEVVYLDYYNVDENYLENLSLSLVAGRNFEAGAGDANKATLLINETAVKKLGYETPYDALGESLVNPEDSSRSQIIGVLKDYNHQLLTAEIAPMALKYNPAGFNIVQVRYDGDRAAAAASVEKAWQEVNPGQKISYNDFQEEVHGFYKTIFSDFVSIVGVITFLAIAISCLGLLGMATYTIETRLKEIAIRKVLGSGTPSLVFLLSRGFVILIAIAILIAVPAAWFLNNLWLEQIAYRTGMGPAVIIAAIAILFGLGLVTIGSQTLKAAYTNPVDNLRNE